MTGPPAKADDFPPPPSDTASTKAADDFPPPPSDTASSSNGYSGPPSRLSSGSDIEDGNNTNSNSNAAAAGGTTTTADQSSSHLFNNNRESFNDEPKNKVDAIVGEAAFVNDDGEGNTSIMKPRKPAFHHRAVDSHRNIGTKMFDDPDDDNVDDLNNDNDDDDDDDTVAQYRNSKYHIISNSVFVFSSALYVAMACMTMDYYWHYKDVPKEVMNADDDAAWWNYFINCTDDQFFPENVTNADDDNTWMVWYNETAFFDDDIVWLPKIANENADGYEPYVSKYMLLYFWAALGFIITGVVEVFLARKYFWYRMLYYIMIVAAAFGLVSAILLNKDPLWSNICNAISVHVWALEAIIILVQRCRGQSESNEFDKHEGFFGLPIRTWFFIADISFLIGTLGDVATSYFYILGYTNYELGIASIVFAMGWLICALVYLAISIWDHIQYKQYFIDLQQVEDGNGKRQHELIAIPMTIGTGLDDYGNTSTNNNRYPIMKTNTTTHPKKSSLQTTEASDEISSSPPESSNNSSSNSGRPPEDGEEEKKDDDEGSPPFQRSDIGHPTSSDNEKSMIDTTIPDNTDIATATTDDVVADESCCAVPITTL
jgi:uncharacterized membrane protein YciS (DUF1049 family)